MTISVKDWNHLCRAAQKGASSIVKRMIESNPDIDGFDKWCAASDAVKNGHLSVVKVIVDSNIGEDIIGQLLIEASEAGKKDIVLYLLPMVRRKTFLIMAANKARNRFPDIYNLLKPHTKFTDLNQL
ncbi:MAG TPA: ankyrin repeat domain-containing protein [Armatimonadota bacterium]|nr:ankyrin repeat domain-containing protein [Armatimonadota bacterium]